MRDVLPLIEAASLAHIGNFVCLGKRSYLSLMFPSRQSNPQQDTALSPALAHSQSTISHAVLESPAPTSKFSAARVGTHNRFSGHYHPSKIDPSQQPYPCRCFRPVAPGIASNRQILGLTQARS